MHKSYFMIAEEDLSMPVDNILSRLAGFNTLSKIWINVSVTFFLLIDWVPVSERLAQNTRSCPHLHVLGRYDQVGDRGHVHDDVEDALALGVVVLERLEVQLRYGDIHATCRWAECKRGLQDFVK